jgi:hypothetical protein
MTDDVVDPPELTADEWLSAVDAELVRQARRHLRSFPTGLVNEVLYDGDTPEQAARFLLSRGRS